MVSTLPYVEIHVPSLGDSPKADSIGDDNCVNVANDDIPCILKNEKKWRKKTIQGW